MFASYLRLSLFIVVNINTSRIASYQSLVQIVNLNISTLAGGVFLPAFVPPLPRPETGDRSDNSLVPGPVRGPYDYQA